jgi:hypothetical protein
MATIDLTKGLRAIVDDEDHEWLSQYKWHVIQPGKCQYAARDKKTDGVREYVYMHRLVLGLQKGEKALVDHINMDSLDNRKENLRIATRAQNAWNTSGFGGVSQFKGVSWHSQVQKWTAKIKVNGVSHYLGIFSEEMEAAEAYDKAAVSAHGEFARLNLKGGLAR